MDLCSMRNIFGRPSEGVHAWHIGKVAVVDFALTLAFAFVVGTATPMPADVALVGLLVVAWLVHAAFCVATPTQLFLSGR